MPIKGTKKILALIQPSCKPSCNMEGSSNTYCKQILKTNQNQYDYKGISGL